MKELRAMKVVSPCPKSGELRSKLCKNLNRIEGISRQLLITLCCKYKKSQVCKRKGLQIRDSKTTVSIEDLKVREGIDRFS